MSSSQQSIRLIPEPPAGADEGDGLRQTFLAQIPDPRDRALVTRLSRRLYYLTSRDAAPIASMGCFDRTQLRAVGRDLRFAAWVLSVIGRSSDGRMATVGACLYRGVSALADRIEDEVGR